MENVKEVMDNELLEKAVYDEEAFTELYRKYQNLVYFVAYKMCQNDSDAQDIVQETFIEIKRSLKNLRNPQFFRLWLYRIIDSKCKKLFRKNKFSLTDVEQDHIQNTIIDHKQQNLPEDTLRFQNDSELLLHMVEQLPYDQKFAIIMYYFEQMTTLEIADVLNVPEGTVKSRLSVGRATLKKKITAYENREQIKLDFHDLSGALIMAFAGAMFSTAVPTTCQSKIKESSIKGIKAASLSTKAIVGITAMVMTPVVGLIGYGALSHNQIPESNTINQKQLSFPVLFYEGEEITSEIEAYYALKQHVCKQDLLTLTEQERNELDPLYQALKEEQSVFYERLQETGWSDLYEK